MAIDPGTAATSDQDLLDSITQRRQALAQSVGGDSGDDTLSGDSGDDSGYAVLPATNPSDVADLLAQHPDLSPISSSIERAIATLKAQRAGLSTREKLASLLIGFGQPSQHGFKGAVANASKNLLLNSIAARKNDNANQALIAKYEAMLGPSMVTAAQKAEAQKAQAQKEPRTGFNPVSGNLVYMEGPNVDKTPEQVQAAAAGTPIPAPVKMEQKTINGVDYERPAGSTGKFTAVEVAGAMPMNRDDSKAIAEAKGTIQDADAAERLLKEALEANKLAFDGPLGGIQADASRLTGQNKEALVATAKLNSLLNQAIMSRFRKAFGARPAATELQYMNQAWKGLPHATRAEREASMETILTAVQNSRDDAQGTVDSINADYTKPAVKAGPTPQSSATGLHAIPAEQMAIYAKIPPARRDIAKQRLKDAGYDITGLD